jgi:membrane protein insertase Oxa1/YidC/SpoIIIJ
MGPSLRAFPVTNGKLNQSVLNSSSGLSLCYASSIRCFSVSFRKSRSEIQNAPVLSSDAESIGSTLIDQTTKITSAITTPLSNLDTNSILSSIHALGDLKAAGLASSATPVGWIQSLLEVVHVGTGLPWWASIALVTLVIRGAMFPLMIKLQRHTAILHNIRPEMDKLMAEVQQAKLRQDQQKLAVSSEAMTGLFKKHNTHPLRALGVPLLQMPVMVSFFLAIRKIAESDVLSFKSGGALWFMDLSIPDPTYALPVIASAGFLVALEVLFFLRTFFRRLISTHFRKCDAHLFISILQVFVSTNSQALSDEC